MTIFIKKLCNALISDAVPAPGLWVGGTVTVSADALDWIPNAMNKALHASPQPVHISLREVRAVRREFGILTGIVVVELEGGGEFRFRCFNARSVAENMFDLLPSQVMSA